MEDDISRPDGEPWAGVVGLRFTDDGQRLFAWEREGRVWIIDASDPVPDAFIDLREEVLAWRDHGLLGFALDPAFRANGYVYLLYAVDRHHLESCSEPPSGTGPPQCGPGYDPEFSILENRATIGRLTRYRAVRPAGAADYASATSVEYDSRTVLFGETRQSACPIIYSTHGIGSLAFGRDGTLLAGCGDSAAVGVADAGNRGQTAFREALSEGLIRPEENVGAFRSQMVNSHSGKILRLDPLTGDGVPGNPFFDSANPRSPASRVWALGVRNPYRMTFRPGTGSLDPADADPGVLYLGDVGWVTWEDFHVVQTGGQNLGWPLFEGIQEQPDYVAVSPEHPEAPNPLAGSEPDCGANFNFADLIRQASRAASQRWPNPCVPSEDIDTVPVFLHSAPLLDWRHEIAETRSPGYAADGELVIVSLGEPGPDGTRIAGVPFAGNTSTAGTWYLGNDFPATYRNTYFHADFGSQWIRNFVLDGADRLTEVRPFASDAGGVVFVASDPQAGHLYYISWASFVRRISYAPGGNRPPEAAFAADREFGPAPLAVSFDAAASYDPEGTGLTYEWDFGDGSVAPGGPGTTHTFDPGDSNPRGYTVTLRVTDGGGASDTVSRVISVNNTPPDAEIISPADGDRYSTTTATYFPLEAALSDAEHASASLDCEWQVVFHQNDTTVDDPPLDGCSQETTLLPRQRCSDETLWYSVHLAVTDPAGLTGRVSSRIYPDCPGVPPVAVADAATVAEGGEVAVPVLANDTAEGTLNPYSLELTEGPTEGTALVGTDDGIVIYRHSGQGGSGSDQFRYLVRDNLGNPSNEAIVSISVPDEPPPNDAPVQQPVGDRQTRQSELLEFTVTAQDPDGPLPLTMSATGLPPGATYTDLGSGLGRFSWTPDSGAEAQSPYMVTFEATDGGGLSDSETIEIRVDAAVGGEETIYEAESASAGGGVQLSTRYAGYTGSGYVEFRGSSDLLWTVTVPSAGEYELAIRYAVGIKDRKVVLTVDGATVPGVSVMPATGSWSSWGEIRFSRNLSAGTHQLRLSGTQNRGPNVDHLSVKGTGPAPPALAFDTQSLAFSVEEGSGLTGVQLVGLTADDSAAVDVSLVASKGWLDVNPAFVVTPASGIEVRVDAGGLAPGTYSALVTASADGYGTDSLPVSLTVTGIGGGGDDTIYEAESASAGGGVQLSTRYAGYTGSGYVEFRGSSDLLWTVTVPSAGEYELAIRYAVGIKDRKVVLTVDGATVPGVSVMPATGSWSSWGEIRFSRNLSAGTHQLRLSGTQNRGPNVDHLSVKGSVPP